MHLTPGRVLRPSGGPLTLRDRSPCTRSDPRPRQLSEAPPSSDRVVPDILGSVCDGESDEMRRLSFGVCMPDQPGRAVGGAKGRSGAPPRWWFSRSATTGLRVLAQYLSPGPASSPGLRLPVSTTPRKEST